MIVVALALVVAAASVDGTDSAAFVKASDALLPDVLRPSSKLDGLLASAADLRPIYVAATSLNGKGDGAQVDKLVRAALAEQQPKKDAAVDLHADAALVTRHGDVLVDVTLFDRAHKTKAQLSWVQVAGAKPGALHLTGAPFIERGTVDKATENVRAPDATHFVAELAANGGVVRIDEKDALVVVSKCKGDP